MTRRNVALVVVALWAGGLILFARRQIVQSPLERLLDASLRIAPATYYYTVEMNGQVIGAAMSMVDTTDKRIVTSDMFTGRYPVGPDTLAMTARANATYSRALLLKDFAFELEGDQIPVTIRGRTVGDSILLVATQSSSDSISRIRHRLTSPAFMPTFAPIVGLLSRERNVGDTIHVSLFDPLSRVLKLVTIQVHEDSLFQVPDSAVLDRKTREWRSAWTDTVRARRLGGDGSSLTVWVDKDGRIVAASESGGLRMTRTAYELAFRRKGSTIPAPAQKP